MPRGDAASTPHCPSGAEVADGHACVGVLLRGHALLVLRPHLPAATDPQGRRDPILPGDLRESQLAAARPRALARLRPRHDRGVLRRQLRRGGRGLLPAPKRHQHLARLLDGGGVVAREAREARQALLLGGARNAHRHGLGSGQRRLHTLHWIVCADVPPPHGVLPAALPVGERLRHDRLPMPARGLHEVLERVLQGVEVAHSQLLAVVVQRDQLPSGGPAFGPYIRAVHAHQAPLAQGLEKLLMQEASSLEETQRLEGVSELVHVGGALERLRSRHELV
mmetsp:Transcript_80378/g.223492  ORF Transcript_80378/g.223492 Transcript_80378/m.223492 type:complete len:280 (-) Transcript_80378:309-1148(-)